MDRHAANTPLEWIHEKHVSIVKVVVAIIASKLMGLVAKVVASNKDVITPPRETMTQQLSLMRLIPKQPPLAAVDVVMRKTCADGS